MKITLDSIISGFKSVTKLIANFDSIESELNDKVLYRDNPDGEPNQMNNNLDMNGNRISNLPNGIYATDAATYSQLLSVSSGSGTGVGTTKAGAVATGAQVLYTVPTYVQGANNLSVYVDGALSQDYAETSTTTITFGTAPTAAAALIFIVNERVVDATLNVASSVTATLEGSPTNVQDAINSVQTDLNTAESSLATAQGDITTLDTRVDAHDVILDTVDIIRPQVDQILYPVVGKRYELNYARNVVRLPAGASIGDRISFTVPMRLNSSNTSTANTLAIEANGADLIYKDVIFGQSRVGTTTGSLVLALTHPKVSDYDNPAFLIGQYVRTNAGGGTTAAITAYDSSTNTVSCGALAITTSDSYRIGVPTWDSDLNDLMGDITLGYVEGGWIAIRSVTGTGSLPGPRRARSVGFSAFDGAEETLEQYLVESDTFSNARLDSSLSPYFLPNATTVGAAPTGATRIPTYIHWVGTSTLTLTANESLVNADRYGTWVGDRETTTVVNASVGNDIILSIAGLSSTVDLTLCNGTVRDVTGTTISFTAPSTISDSANGLGVYRSGDIVKVTGSASNNRTYVVATAGAGTMVVVETNIITETAGATVTATAGVQKGNDVITVPPGCEAVMRRLSTTEVLVTTSHSRVTK